MKKVLQITNGVAFVSTVFINYLSNTGVLNNTTIGEVSDSYKSLFTPAGYTFAIWGIIYLMLAGFVFYQGRSLFVNVRKNDFVIDTGWWFVASCVFNSAWVFAWIYEFTAVSCIFIFLLLISLLKIIWNNRMELDDEPISTIVFLWWPFVIYAGWVTVASIANVSTYLLKIDWNGLGLSPETWTIIMVIIATFINLLAVWKRNLREFAAVGIWALLGIANANADTNTTIENTCYGAAIILFFTVMIHGYKNRRTNPFFKFLEWRAAKN
ncbi:tryptophan-rich sensory protein [Winogradskyella litorisediminis]|uniref:Tryptophan-rich sensory protein n=1 Tax=Winogradskyella litorisediminis TaxID=1156618 RepID=A0ABW3NAH9_9FLAO